MVFLNKENVRYPVMSGTFYPKSLDELSSFLTSSLENQYSGVKGIIVPHAGYVYSGSTASAGYSVIRKNNYENIILIGPSHNYYFNGLISSSFDKWIAPNGEIDQAKVKLPSEINIFNQAIQNEHCLEVQIPFIIKYFPSSKIIPILTGDIINISKTSSIIQNLWNENSLIIVSSDLSHYNPKDEANKIDSDTIKMILKKEISIPHDRACGADGINILNFIAKSNGWKPKLVKYSDSSEFSGIKDNVVGYASIIYL